MSQKRKRGLQSGLNEIIERQTAPAPDKSKESSSLIAKFRDQPQAETNPLQPPPTSLQPKAVSPPSAAPARDFARVANSITRDAMPGGLFKGTSKKTYDALYLRTRGAIAPVRELKARQSDLMGWANVSHNTLRSHIHHLEAVRLIEIKWELGDNNGAVYEVRLPEEIDHLLPPPTTSLQPPPTSNQKLGGPSYQKVVLGGGGQSYENKGTSENPKTSLRLKEENLDDDAALAGLNEVLRTINRELTGKDLSRMEADRWRELAEVLAAELKIAAARTTVSSVPSFLAEHLRRRLWKLDKKQARAEGKELPDEGMKAAPTVDSSKCPDCSGAGWWYPEGAEKGVAKCSHPKLREGK